MPMSDKDLTTHAAKRAEVRNDELVYCGATRCRDCPDDIDRDPSVAVILPSSASIKGDLNPDDRVFVRASSGIIELLAAEQYGTNF